MKPRTDTDSMGTVEVPESAYWGAQTQRALEHFAIGDERLPPAFIHAYALVKQAAAEANRTLGEISAERASWIASAALRLREAALELGSVSAEQFDAWVQPDQMLVPEAADGEA